MNMRERILLESRLWKIEKENLDKDYFKSFSGNHLPKLLWIESFGNAATVSEITNTEPHEVVVYKNHGGLCRGDDANFMAILESFIESSDAQNIVVCGHSNCNAIRNTVAGKAAGAYASRWLEEIHELNDQYAMEMSPLSPRQKERKLSELNIRRQLDNLRSIDVIQRAWANGRSLQLLGWYLDLNRGEIQEIEAVSSRDFHKEVTARH